MVKMIQTFALVSALAYDILTSESVCHVAGDFYSLNLPWTTFVNSPHPTLVTHQTLLLSPGCLSPPGVKYLLKQGFLSK